MITVVGFGCGEECLGRFCPVRKDLLKVGAIVRVASVGRGILHGKPVDAIAGNRGDAETLSSSPPFPHVTRFDVCRPWADSTPAGVAGVTWFFRAKNRSANHGTNPVRADDHLGFVSLAVLEPHLGTFLAHLDPDALMAVTSNAWRKVGTERCHKIGAVDQANEFPQLETSLDCLGGHRDLHFSAFAHTHLGVNHAERSLPN